MSGDKPVKTKAIGEFVIGKSSAVLVTDVSLRLVVTSTESDVDALADDVSAGDMSVDDMSVDDMLAGMSTRIPLEFSPTCLATTR